MVERLFVCALRRDGEERSARRRRDPERGIHQDAKPDGYRMVGMSGDGSVVRESGVGVRGRVWSEARDREHAAC